jgi:fructose-1,6-bisphosphatase/inositol monophosphatase family enzyme
MAAGACIVAEAGGIVTDADGGPLKLHGGSICAAAPGLSGPLTEEIRAAGH